MRRLDVATAEKQRQALKMRSVGYEYERIATDLGYADKSGAWRAVKAACDRAVIEPAREQRMIMADRLDILLQRTLRAVLEGDLDQVTNVLRVEKRRAELFGLDAPRGFEVSGPGGDPIQTDVGEILRERIAALRDRAATTTPELPPAASNGSENGSEGEPGDWEALGWV